MQDSQAHEDSDLFRSACAALGDHIFPHTAHLPSATPPRSTAPESFSLTESDDIHTESAEKDHQPAASLPHAEPELVSILEQLPQRTAVQVLRASQCTVDEQLCRLPTRVHHLALHGAFPELAASSSLHIDCTQHSPQAVAAALRLFQTLGRPERLSIVNLHVLASGVGRGLPGVQAGLWGATKACRALQVHHTNVQNCSLAFLASSSNSLDDESFMAKVQLKALTSNTHITSLCLQGHGYELVSPVCETLQRISSLEHLVFEDKQGDYPGFSAMLVNVSSESFQELSNLTSSVFTHEIPLFQRDLSAYGSLAMMTRLRDLQLVVHEDLTQGEGHQVLTRCLQSLFNLSRLRLSVRSSEADCRQDTLSWAGSLMFLTKLQCLHICSIDCARPDLRDPETYNFGLDEQQLSELASAVVGLPCLQELSLSIACVDTGVLALLRTLGTSAALTSLTLHTTADAEPKVSFAEVLQRACSVGSLQRLQLRSCVVLHSDDAPIDSSMHTAAQLTALTSLEVSISRVVRSRTMQGSLSPIIPFLGACHELRSLKLQQQDDHAVQNESASIISDEQAVQLSCQLARMTQLKALCLEGLHVQGDALSFASLRHLTSLRLSMQPPVHGLIQQTLHARRFSARTLESLCSLEGLQELHLENLRMAGDQACFCTATSGGLDISHDS